MEAGHGVQSTDYVEDDDSASSSSAEVDKAPASLFEGETSAAEAVERLQAVLGSSLRLDDGNEDEEDGLSSFIVPALETSRENDDMFAGLPDDCLAAIFRKLANKDLAQCALVCKWWFMVDALSRSSLSLRATHEIEPHLPKLLSRFQGVHKLVLKCDRNMASINDHALDTIAQNCPRLRKFKLKNCKMVTDVGMESFARQCMELRKFSCGGCGFGVAGLSALLRFCTVLEDLTIKRSIRAIAAVANADGAGAAADGVNTLTLSLAGGGRIVVGIPVMFDPNAGPPAPGAAGGQAQGPGAAPGAGAGAAAPPGNQGVAAAILQGGPRAGPVPGGAQVKPATLDLPEELNLRRLCLKDQSTSQMWVPLLEAARKVETLILARNGGSWDPVLGSSLGAGKMPELTQLYLEKLHISDRALRSVAKCPKLEALVVVRTPECTDEGIAAIAQGCATLKRLHIEGWAAGHIGDRGLNSLAHHCRLLQELVLVGHSCTVVSMQPLASNCPGLERLTLCSSLSMSDQEMKVISSSCTNLRRLCVKACMRVTDVGIFALATGCPSLQKLKIRRCNGVSQSSLDYLQEQRPELSITQESSSAATAAAEAARRVRLAAEAEGAGAGGAGAGGAGMGTRVFEERDDIEYVTGAMRRRMEQRDESPELLRRFGSFGSAAGADNALRHRGGTRARFAQAATSIQRALRSWMGGAGGGGGTGLPPHPHMRPFSPLHERERARERERDNREHGDADGAGPA